MKAWPLLLLGISTRIGACAEPPRRPPTTYVPLVRSPETPSLPGPDGPAPLGLDPSSGPSAASSKAASNDKPDKPDKPTPGNDPVNDTKCFKKLPGECCAEPGVPRVTKNGKTSCPAGMLLGSKCKGIGKSCHP